MTFEEFETCILKNGYGIVAMNHYSINGERYLYCVIMNKDGSRAIKEEGKESTKVFQSILDKLFQT
jgi:hypothetical protein